MNRHFRLSDFAITFSTRTKGDEVANSLSEYIKTLYSNDTLVIDFTGVKAISYSFLDQFLSKVSQFPLLEEKRIRIAGWTKDLFPAIDRSLQHRSCSYSKSELKSEQILICPH